MPRLDSTRALLEVARSATQGITFQERMKEITKHLSVVVPSASQSALVVQLTEPTQPPAELAWFGNGDVRTLIEYGTRFVHLDPMLLAAKAADGTPQLMSDFVKAGSRWFTEEYLRGLRVKHLMGVAHRMPDGSVLLYALHRRHGDSNFSRRDRRLLAAVSSDVARAAHAPVLKSRIEVLASGSNTTATLLLDRRGNVIHADMAGLALNEAARTTGAAITRTARSFMRSRVRERTVLITIGASRARIRLERLPPGTPIGALALLSKTSDAPLSRVLSSDQLLRLTRREQEVAHLAAQRLANDEIAQRLKISLDTVKSHLKRVYAKLGVDGWRGLACKTNVAASLT